MIRFLFTFLGIGLLSFSLSCNKKTEIIQNNEKPIEGTDLPYFFNYSTLEFSKNPKNIDLLHIGITQNINHTLPLVPAELKMAYEVHPKKYVAPHLVEKKADQTEIFLEYFSFYPQEAFGAIILKINDQSFALSAEKINFQERKDAYVCFQTRFTDCTKIKILDEKHKKKIYFVEITLDESFFENINTKEKMEIVLMHEGLFENQGKNFTSAKKTTQDAGAYIFPEKFDFSKENIAENHPYWTGKMSKTWQENGVILQE